MVNISLSFKADDGLYMLSESTTSDDVRERIAALKQQEVVYESAEYLPTPRTELSEKCVATMCQWCYQVVDHYGFERDTTQMALRCLEAFLRTPQGKPFLETKSQYQLASMACLYLIIKVHERVELDVSAFCLLSRNAYNETQIRQVEQTIIFSLNWRLCPPTAAAFVRCYIQLLPSSLTLKSRRTLLNLALHQTYIASCSYNLSTRVSPSATALACVLNAFEILGEYNRDEPIGTFHACQYLSGCCNKQLEAVAFCQSTLIVDLSNNKQFTLTCATSSTCRTTLTRAKSSTTPTTNTTHHTSGNSASPVAIVSAK